jgi:hypothetical protein
MPVCYVVLVDIAHPNTRTQEVRSRMDGNKEVEFAQNDRERDNLVPAVGGATCFGGVSVILRKSKWEKVSGHIWPGIAARRQGECGKYGGP